ncbi:polygalacturonase-like [Cylas formicarius]|uniref:polygalacturonase-like n=1 Tax=Cylas formicarius TaxID=197179 RepID=UPI002958CCC2|nr:polygalacturonase-like [Cylas formicarius]
MSAFMFSFVLLTLLTKASPASAEPCVVTQFDEVEAATKTCLDIVLDNLFVPANVTLKLNLTDGATVTFKGNITFGYAIWDGPLVTINGTSITVKGAEGSVCDGQGQLYWDGQGGWSGPKPQFFTIQAFGGSVFRDIYVLNSPMDVVQVTNSDDVLFTNWVIDDSVGDKGVAPTGKEGHNTDAFDVWNSTNVEIRDSIVYNQDDCLAVRCGANVYVHDLFCHGSHGLSISVGFSNDSVPLNTLENVTIADSVIVNSDNGIHIKTHIDGGYGSIKNVTYRNITMSDMNNFGITIEQNYQNRAPGSTGTAEPKNNVPISDLKMINVTGTVGSKAVPIHIVCAEDGCFDWSWSGVSVTGKKSNDCNYEPQGYSC